VGLALVRLVPLSPALASCRVSGWFSAPVGKRLATCSMHASKQLPTASFPSLYIAPCALLYRILARDFALFVGATLYLQKAGSCRLFCQLHGSKSGLWADSGYSGAQPSHGGCQAGSEVETKKRIRRK